MENKKNMPVKDYDRTNRNFQSTDEDLRADKKDKQRLQPEKYPVNNESAARGNGDKSNDNSNR